jgi:hypothetical protein
VSLMDQGRLKLTAQEPSSLMLAAARTWASSHPTSMNMWEAAWRSMWDRA